MRADRLLSIVLLLQTRGKMTTRALAAELEVSRRTILRDIDALSIAGVPLYTDSGHGGGIALDEGYRTSLTGLSEPEVHALFIDSNRQLLAEIGLGDAAERMQRKLAAALPDQHRRAVDHIRQRIYIDPVWWWHDSQPLPFWLILQEAVYQDRCIRVVYETRSGDIRERHLEPYSLVSKSSTWYLAAKREGEFRTYRVSRLRDVVMLDAFFERDPEFDLVSYWHEHLDEFAAAFAEYLFTLRVHADRLRFVQRLTPGRYEVLDTGKDGWATLRFQMESADLARMLVFELGNQCEVVEPLELAEEVMAGCQEVLAHLAR